MTTIWFNTAQASAKAASSTSRPAGAAWAATRVSGSKDLRLVAQRCRPGLVDLAATAPARWPRQRACSRWTLRTVVIGSPIDIHADARVALARRLQQHRVLASSIALGGRGLQSDPDDVLLLRHPERECVSRMRRADVSGDRARFEASRLVQDAVVRNRFTDVERRIESAPVGQALRASEPQVPWRRSGTRRLRNGDAPRCTAAAWASTPQAVGR